MFPKLRPKRLLNHQNRQKCLHINVAEQPLKPPSYALSAHAKGLVDHLAIGALEDHVTQTTRLQLDPEILRGHQHFQVFQECPVLLG